MNHLYTPPPGTVGLPLHAGGTPAPPSSSLFACGGLLLKPSTTTHSHKKHSPHGHVHCCFRLSSTCRHPEGGITHAGTPPLPRPHMSSYVPRVPDAVAGSPRMIYTGVYSDIYRPTRVVPVIRTPFLAAGRTAAVGRSLTERGSRSCGHARRRRRCAPCWVAPHRLFAQKRPEGKGEDRALAGYSRRGSNPRDFFPLRGAKSRCPRRISAAQIESHIGSEKSSRLLFMTG